MAGWSASGDAPKPMDLTDEAPNSARLASGEGLFKRRHLEDWTRLGLAAGLSVLLGLLVLGTGLTVVVAPGREPAVESYLKLVFTPVVGLVGSVVGFYFGSRDSGGK